MWKSGKKADITMCFYPQKEVEKEEVFNRERKKDKRKKNPQKFYPQSTEAVEKSEAGINIGSNIADIILQGCVTAL